MKALYYLISSFIAIVATVSCASAQTLRQTSGKDGLYGIEAVDNNTGKVTSSLPTIFQHVILPQNAAEAVVAKIADRTFVALDANLDVIFDFPNGIDDAYGFNGGTCVVKGPGYETGYGAIDGQGNVILRPEYDYIGRDMNNGLVGFKGVVCYSDKNSWRGKCFEVSRIGTDKSENESFILNVPYYRFRTARHDMKILPVLFSADSISRYIQSPLEHTIALGLNRMVNGDYRHATAYFRKALRSEETDEELSASMNYNLMACKVMATGRACRLPKRDNLHEYEIDAALFGLYGQKVAGFFKSHYELPLLCMSDFYLDEMLPYAVYSGKLYCDRNMMNPLRMYGNSLYGCLLERRDAFVQSLSLSGISYDELDTMVVSVDSIGTCKFCTGEGKKYPDSRFRLSYYLDIRLFMQSLIEEYQLSELVMTFPY